MDRQPEGTGNSMDRAVEALDAHFAPEEEAEVQETEAPEEADEAESVEELDEESGEAEESEDDDTDQDEEESEAIESLEQVAEALGMPLADFLSSLKHKVKIDGETLEVTLDELQAGYQKDRDYRQKTEAVKRDREQWEQQRSQAMEQLQQEHAHNAYILNTLEQQVVDQINSEEMQQLRQTNREEWLVKRYEAEERLKGYGRLKQEAAQRYQQLQQQAEQERLEKLSKQVETERGKLAEKIPDWGPQKVQALNDYLGSAYGFTPEEIGQVYDSRLVEMAWKASQFDQQKTAAETAVKKVKKAPKLVRPTKQKPRVRADDVRTLRGKLRKSGRTEDAAKLIENLL